MGDCNTCELKRRVERLEGNDERQDRDIRQLYEIQAATKVYVEEIRNDIKELKAQLNSWASTLLKSRNKDEELQSTERAKYMELIKWVIGATSSLDYLYFYERGDIGEVPSNQEAIAYWKTVWKTFYFFAGNSRTFTEFTWLEMKEPGSVDRESKCAYR